MSGDRLGTHLRLARQHGLDEAALSGLMTLLANYLGYPKASLVIETVHTFDATPRHRHRNRSPTTLSGRTRTSRRLP